MLGEDNTQIIDGNNRYKISKSRFVFDSDGIEIRAKQVIFQGFNKIPVFDEVNIQTIKTLANQVIRNREIHFGSSEKPITIYYAFVFELNICKISPMLLYYIESKNYTVNWGETDVNKMEFIPVRYLTYCSHDDDTKNNLLAQNCKKKLIAGIPNLNYIDYYVLNKNSPQCGCSQNTLAPLSEKNNPDTSNVSKCFDITCNRNGNYPECKNPSSYCDTLRRWVYAPKEFISNDLKNLDWVRLHQICGNSFKPYQVDKFNKKMFIDCVIIYLLTLFLIYISKQNKTKKKIIIYTIIFIPVTLFLSYEFGGESQCDYKTKKKWCSSKLLKKDIHQSYCSYDINCECTNNDDCKSKNCTSCSDGLCVNDDGVRDTHVQKIKNKPNYFALLFRLILIILCVLIINILLNRNFVNMNLIVKIIIFILLVLLLSVNLIYKNFFSKYERTIPSPTCKSDRPLLFNNITCNKILRKDENPCQKTM